MLKKFVEILRIYILSNVFFISVLFIRSRNEFRTYKPLLIYLVCLMSYLTLDIEGLEESLLFHPLHTFNFVLPFSFLLLSKSIFDDDFEWKNKYWIAIGFIVGITYFAHYQQGFQALGFSADINKTFKLIPFSLSILFAILAIVEAAKNQDSDLIISRLQFRILFIGLTAFIMVLTILVEIAFLPNEIPLQLDLAQKMFIAILSSYFLISQGELKMNFLRRNGESKKLILNEILQKKNPIQVDSFKPSSKENPLTSFKSNLPNESSKTEIAEINTPPKPIGNPIITELLQLMEIEKHYQTEGLKIPQLAQKMNVKEYKLRQTINQELGFRNFNAFLNSFFQNQSAFFRIHEI